jgi:putative tryptophan/tyrosine transport system substrate-binding protein
MKRRDFLGALSAAAAWPLAARAQQPAIPAVGFLGGPSRSTYAENIAAIHRGLREAGYVEGQNLTVEHRWAEGQYDRLPALAADLVNRRVNVIVTLGGPPPALAAKAATSTIPIVFHMGADPVELGIVATLGRPGGNITGATMLAVALEAKRLALVREMAPTATLFGMFINPHNPQTRMQVREVQEAAARVIGLNVLFLHVSSERELETAFSELAEKRAGGLIIGADAYVANMFAQHAALAARHRIPAIGGSRDFARAGGLMSYGTSVADVYRQAGVSAGRILKGEKPANLPVTQPTRFELIINLRTAKALELTVPNTLLVGADEVIE